MSDFGGEWDDGDVGKYGVLITGANMDKERPDQIASLETRVVGGSTIQGHVKRISVTPETYHLAEQARKIADEKIANGEVVIGESVGGLAVTKISVIHDIYCKLLDDFNHKKSQATKEVKLDTSLPTSPKKVTQEIVVKTDQRSDDDWDGAVNISRYSSIDDEFIYEQDGMFGITGLSDTPSQPFFAELTHHNLAIRFKYHWLVELANEGLVLVYDERNTPMSEKVFNALLELNIGNANLTISNELPIHEKGQSFDCLIPCQLFRWGVFVFVMFMFE